MSVNTRLLRLVRSELLRDYPDPGRGGDAASASRSGSEGRQGAVYGAPAITAVGKDPADAEPALFVPVTSTSTVDPTSEPSST